MSRCCADCAYFEGRGAAVEAAFPGLSAMSSGYASVRGGDGLCALRDLYLPGSDGCGRFQARGAGGTVGAGQRLPA